MKNTLYFLCFFIIGCSSNNDSNEDAQHPFGVQNPDNMLKYNINGKTIEMEYFYMNAITSYGDTIGKHIGAYVETDNEREPYLSANLYFYTSPDDPSVYDFFEINILVWDEDAETIQGTYYSNSQLNNPLPFEHDIIYDNGKISGDFSGMISQPNDTLNVSGRLEFIVPSEQQQ